MILSLVLFVFVPSWLAAADARPVARVDVSTLWIDFDEVELGDDANDEFTLENSGEVPVEIEDMDLNGDSDVFQFDSDCPDILQPGDDCSIQVTFEPEELGEFSGDIEIETSAGELNVTLSGVGIPD
jgi:hypothetical protein